MKRQILYKYLGTNGTIMSPVHLEDTYYVRYVRLIANDGYQLTNDYNTFVKSIVIPEEETENWTEVEEAGQN